MARSLRTFWLLLAVVLASCGRDRAASHEELGPPPPNPSPTKKAALLLFAGGNCEPCRKELPMLQERLRNLESKKRSRILVTVYVTQNATGGGKVEQTYANQFGKELGLEFTMVADKYGNTYQKRYYAQDKRVPGTVITTEAGEVVKVYAPGIVDLDILFSEIDAALK